MLATSRDVSNRGKQCASYRNVLPATSSEVNITGKHCASC